MKRSLLTFAAFAIVVASVSSFAQDLAAPAKGSLVAPPSTVVGKVRTPLYILIPEGRTQPGIPNGETPSSLACIYGVTPPTNGCPKDGTIVPAGGTRAIAVVDFGRYSNLQSDLNTFSAQFGLPNATITEICTPGPPPCPANNGTGWDVEEALDLEYAHAMAPNAQIILAEFTNDPLTDGAETAAAAAVAAAGGGEVSNSWTYGQEFPEELGLDSYFTTPTVVYFASASSSGTPEYPSVSPNVVSAGGTHIVRDADGNFTGEEDCWGPSGISLYEPLPQYQLILSNITGPRRGTPDWAADADGVVIYNSSSCDGFCVVSGTSVSSPLLAGIVNAAGSFAKTTMAELSKTYTLYRTPGSYHKYFYDVTKPPPAKLGWDICTGLGSPRNLGGF